MPTVSLLHRRKMGNGYMNVCDITLDSSYPTGGEAITPQQLGLTALDFVLPSPAAGYIFEFDHANSKLKAFTPTVAQASHTHAFTGDALATHQHTQQVTTGSTAAADSTSGALAEDSAAIETAVRLMGTAIDTTYDLGKTEAVSAGTPSGTNAPDGAISASAATEVANGTDLSSVTVRVIAIGL